MAGNPPADAAQPSGMNGMMVTIATKLAQAPAAPRTPRRFSQNPRSMSAGRPFPDSEEPGSSPDPEHGVHPGDERTIADVGNQCPGLVLEPFLVSEKGEGSWEPRGGDCPGRPDSSPDKNQINKMANEIAKVAEAECV
jgi:hypothetical protein